MNNKDKDLFQEQSTLLKEGIDLLKKRISEIETQARVKSTAAEAAVSIFQKNSLDCFVYALEYITDKLIDDDERIPYFLLPHVRTLMDVYANLLDLFINHSDLKAQSEICTTTHLLAASLIDENEFSKTRKLYKYIINASGIEFPQTAKDFSKKWIKENRLRFLPKSEILIPENIQKFSIEVLEVYKGENMYTYYSTFSEMNHGNPFFITNLPGTERYWTAMLTSSITAFTIELIERRILNKEKSRNLSEWLQKANIAGQKLLVGLTAHRAKIGRT